MKRARLFFFRWIFAQRGNKMVYSAAQSFYRRQLPANLVDLSSNEGKQRFRSALAAGTAEAFFTLVSQYQTQSHPALCGLTTLTIMLNALKIDPGRVWMNPWRWFAETLLDCCLTLDKAKVDGITMDQLAGTASCNGAEATVYRECTLQQARELIVKCVSEQVEGREEFIGVAYSRPSLGQTGTGHFSPIAAIDKESESVLILDTARFKVCFVRHQLARLVAICVYTHAENAGAMHSKSFMWHLVWLLTFFFFFSLSLSLSLSRGFSPDAVV